MGALRVRQAGQIALEAGLFGSCLCCLVQSSENMIQEDSRRFTPVRATVGNRHWGNYWEGHSPKLGRRVQLESSHTRIANWQTALGYLRLPPSKDADRLRTLLWSAVASQKRLPLRQLEREMRGFDAAHVRREVFELLRVGAACSDMDCKPLSGGTLVWSA